jgi:hypothetical protein
MDDRYLSWAGLDDQRSFHAGLRQDEVITLLPANRESFQLEDLH